MSILINSYNIEQAVPYVQPRRLSAMSTNGELPNDNAWETEYRTTWLNHKDSFYLSKCPRLAVPRPEAISACEYVFEHRDSLDLSSTKCPRLSRPKPEAISPCGRTLKHKNSLDLSFNRCPRTPLGKRQRSIRMEMSMQEDSKAGCEDPFDSGDIDAYRRPMKKVKFLPDFDDEKNSSITVIQGECCFKKKAKEIYKGLKRRLSLGGPAVKSSGIAPAF